MYSFPRLEIDLIFAGEPGGKFVDFLSEINFCHGTNRSFFLKKLFFVIEIKKGNRHISAGQLVHMDQIVRFNRETPDDILLIQACFKQFLFQKFFYLVPKTKLSKFPSLKL